MPRPPARRAAATTTALLGGPDLSFAARHNLTVVSSHGQQMNIVSLVILAVVAWRLAPRPPLYACIVLGVQAAGCIADLAWRRCSLARAPACRGSYLRWREVLVAIVLRFLGHGAGMRSHLMAIGILADLADSTISGAAAAALLLMASSLPVAAVRWVGWRVRIFWALPAELGALAWLSWGHRSMCSMPALQQPGVQRVSGTTYDALAYLHSAVLPLAGSPGLPSQQAKCGVLLLWLRMGLGLAVPALLQAAHECRLFATHQQQRRQCGLPPKRGWQARAYSSLAAALHPDHHPQLLPLSCLMLLLLSWETAVVLHL